MRRVLALALSLLTVAAVNGQEKVSITTAMHPEVTAVYVYAPSVVRLRKLDSSSKFW